jgi:hypothetical protein
MKYILALLFILFTLSGFSQHIIRGLVLDSATHQPVSYATIINDSAHNGTLADDKGFFKLPFSDTTKTTAVLRIYCVGYTLQYATVNCLTDTNKVYLSRNPVTLSPAGISLLDTNKLCREKWGATRKPFLFQGEYLWHDGSEIAVHIVNTSDSTGVITTIRFYITDEGFPDTPFRAQLYYVDARSGGPGATMLDTNLILHGAKGNEWVVADLSSLNLQMPPEGFFISMQWLPVSKELPYKVTLGKYDIKGDGQVLGMSHEIDNCETWSKFDLLNEWFHFNNTDLAGCANAMIGADVFVPCK